MRPTELTRLLRLARTGCRRSFARLWVAHVAAVRAAVVRRAPADAVDDVVQDVALAALLGLPTLRGEAQFAAWLLAIARNHAASVWQRRRREPLARGGDGDHDLANVIAHDRPFAVAGVWACVRRLPRCYRRMLWWRFVHGSSSAEIAGRLATTEGTVRVALCRAMRLLRHSRPSTASG